MKQSSSADELDRHYREVYTDEAIQYDARRFTSIGGGLSSQFEIEAVIKPLAPVAGRRILDVAAGTGRASLPLAACGAQVVSLDLTSAMLSVAGARARDSGLNSIEFCLGNGRQLPFGDQTFDAVVCTRFFHLLPRQLYPHFTTEMKRVVKPDGKIVITLPNPLYGVGFGLLQEGLRRWIGHRPKEHFLWPHQIAAAFPGMRVVRVGGVWLPGLAGLSRRSADIPRRVCLTVMNSPVRWVANPFVIVAKPQDGPLLSGQGR